MVEGLILKYFSCCLILNRGSLLLLVWKLCSCNINMVVSCVSCFVVVYFQMEAQFSLLQLSFGATAFVWRLV